MNQIISTKLYHGTDNRVFTSSEEERLFFAALCSDIAEFSYQKFLEDGLSISAGLFEYKRKRGDLLGNDYYSLLDCFQKYDSYKKGSQYYQYNNLYLTSLRDKAEHYARLSNVFGERGHVAFCLYQSALKLWDIKCEADPIMLCKIEQFEELCCYKPEPIILVFENVPKQYLLGEFGKQIDWEDNIETSFRCSSDFLISDYLSSIIHIEQKGKKQETQQMNNI